MTHIILSGCNCAMGRVIFQCAKDRGDCSVVAGIDPNTERRDGYVVYPSAEQCAEKADAIIDFSHPSALDGLLDLNRRTGIPLVVATTGLSEAQKKQIEEAAKRAPVFHSANMSLGINLMVQLAKMAARVLGGTYDIEIVEKHHHRKLDAPSGTALMLADSIAAELAEEPQYIYERHSRRQKRAKNEIGLHAIRGGTIVGEHEIIFAGRDEVFTLTHSATSREVFATGALEAAIFMKGKKPGLYSMQDLVSGK